MNSLVQNELLREAERTTLDMIEESQHSINYVNQKQSSSTVQTVEKSP